jgi:hypothetical protein
MARKKIEDTGVVIESGEVLPAIAHSITETTNQAAEHSLQIMDSYGEGLPYDRSRVVHEARFYMAQSAEAMLEAGKRLVILKEHEPHGDFENIVREQLALPERTAQRMMQSAIKYLSPKLQSKAPALALLGKTKMFELMTEDDDALAQLADGGTVAGMLLDDIDRMSSRELRKALREAKADVTAKTQVIASKNKKIDDQLEQILRIEKITPDEVATQLRKELNAFADEVEERIRVQLAKAFVEVQAQSGMNGIDQDEYLASRLDLLDKALLYVRGEVGIERTAELSNKPEWENA